MYRTYNLMLNIEIYKHSETFCHINEIQIIYVVNTKQCI